MGDLVDDIIHPHESQFTKLDLLQVSSIITYGISKSDCDHDPFEIRCQCETNIIVLKLHIWPSHSPADTWARSSGPLKK